MQFFYNLSSLGNFYCFTLFGWFMHFLHVYFMHLLLLLFYFIFIFILNIFIFKR